MSALIVVGTVFVVLAAVLHIVIFASESLLWSRPAVWRRFGITKQEYADLIKPMAFNQGFYNLFLAIGAIIGVILLWSGGWMPVGAALIFLSVGSMLAAALVLIISSPNLARAAITQGVTPLIGLVLLGAGLAAG